VYLENQIQTKGEKHMLSHSSLLDLICERFNSEDMREAFLEKIDERIDYAEMAEAIADEHEDQIAEIVSDLAEDALR
jgi:hypothetical protein